MMTPAETSILTSKIMREVDFPAYLENDVGVDIRWREYLVDGFCICPLHKDGDPSFGISCMENGWVFNCFGCGSGGNIISFFMEYYSESFGQALEHICRRFAIKIDALTLAKEISEVSFKIRDKKQTASDHAVASNICRILLRGCSKDESIVAWVAEAYARMNDALLENDYMMMEAVSDEAYQKLRSI